MPSGQRSSRWSRPRPAPIRLGVGRWRLEQGLMLGGEVLFVGGAAVWETTGPRSIDQARCVHPGRYPLGPARALNASVT